MMIMGSRKTDNGALAILTYDVVQQILVLT